MHSIAYCNDGWYFEGDCAAFRLECGTDSRFSLYGIRMCTGTELRFCLSAALAAQCTDGFYAETACDQTRSVRSTMGMQLTDRETEDTGDAINRVRTIHRTFHRTFI